MFDQLIAAELNVDCLHSNQTCVIAAILDADGWLVTYPVGSNITANSDAWQGIASVYNTLANYNAGLLCAPPR